ncbi:MAG: hydrogenase expression/formation protein HypE [Anaerolineae bacterium]
MLSNPFANLACPIPISDYPTVTLAHGGGGRLSQMLIERMLLPAFSNPQLASLHDGALLEVNGARLAFSTDSFVISPLFFPGGDIGSLAVHGTVNDLAMCGAQPLALSAGFVLEEGLPMQDLWRVVQSMQAAAQDVGVPIVTGDTKVVDRGKGDGIYINTSGIGVIPPGVQIDPQRAQPGDLVLLSGAIAVHGIAIMSVREGLAFETELSSDSAPLHRLTAAMLAVGGDAIHVLRDPTRGGLAASLKEIAQAARVGIAYEERKLPVPPAVAAACDMLGMDPVYVANEGKLVALVAPAAAETILAAMRRHPLGAEAAIIGHVTEQHPGVVVARTSIGGTRIVDMQVGEQLPRIC